MKTLSIRRESDGKLFEISKENNEWRIYENLGRNGRFKAVFNDAVLMWNDIKPFKSMVQAYRFLKENINNLL